MKILVVEDDRDIREMVCRSLAQNDLQAIGCNDVQQARQMMKTQQPDCLVVDWMLPDGSGIELIRWLRRTEPYRQIPVLMLTARAQESDLITGLESGADDYLSQPELSIHRCRTSFSATRYRQPLFSTAPGGNRQPRTFATVRSIRCPRVPSRPGHFRDEAALQGKSTASRVASAGSSAGTSITARPPVGSTPAPAEHIGCF